jgi:hypothetical protein
MSLAVELLSSTASADTDQSSISTVCTRTRDDMVFQDGVLCTGI